MEIVSRMAPLMQLHYPLRRWEFSRPRSAARAVFGAILLVGGGCGERATTLDPSPERLHADVTLTLAAAEPADRDLLRQLARTWAARTGAEVRIADQPWDGTADVGLISTAALPRWAEPGLLADIPPNLKLSSDPYRWDDLLRVYTERLLTWRGRTVALPVLGEGMVLVYRKDAFGKDPPPATWDALLERAVKLGRPSLPPVPADAERLQAEFFSAAACYDRQVVGRIISREALGPDFFAFQFDTDTGEPRLDAPAFQHVARLFHKMAPYRSTESDAPRAFNTGEAKVGVLSLAELGRVNADVIEQLGVAPLPGAGFTFVKDKEQPVDQLVVNRLPYLGWGGRVGVVSAKCANPAAAWDLLAELGNPDRAALDLVAAPKWGAGPYRTSQLDARALARWHAYGFPTGETERLTAALRENTGPGVQNYRLRLRTPNQHELTDALDADLRNILRSDTPDMKVANDRWRGIIRRMPPAEWKDVARKSLGL